MGGCCGQTFRSHLQTDVRSCSGGPKTLGGPQDGLLRRHAVYGLNTSFFSQFVRKPWKLWVSSSSRPPGYAYLPANLALWRNGSVSYLSPTVKSSRAVDFPRLTRPIELPSATIRELPIDRTVVQTRRLCGKQDVTRFVDFAVAIGDCKRCLFLVMFSCAE